jgi:hypothetical protein
MKSLSELLIQSGLSQTGQSGLSQGWPLLNQIQTEGSVVVVKLDGLRTQNCYTLVISDGRLGEDYFRKDGDDLGELITAGVNFYDNLIWRGQAPPTPDSPPSTPRG